MTATASRPRFIGPARPPVQGPDLPPGMILIDDIGIQYWSPWNVGAWAIPDGCYIPSFIVPEHFSWDDTIEHAEEFAIAWCKRQNVSFCQLLWEDPA